MTTCFGGLLGSFWGRLKLAMMLIFLFIGLKTIFLIPPVTILHLPARFGNESGRSEVDVQEHGRNHFCLKISSQDGEWLLENLTQGYLVIQPSGGLNQQRIGICNAVAVAHIINATLVIPKLDNHSFWGDSSNFSDIFDEDHFISMLAGDVPVIRELPPTLLQNSTIFPHLYLPRKSPPEYYVDKVFPKLKKAKVVVLQKFDFRLSNRVPLEIRYLQCRANYRALRYTTRLQEFGRLLVRRLRSLGPSFIALHLRYEKDMLAFSGCDYGGGATEYKEMQAVRARWPALRTHSPESERRKGKCALSPREVGLMLRALGYGSESHIYVASGEIYGGERSLAPLRELFPNLHAKATLATSEELAPFSKHGLQLSAIDHIVCQESDVFVASNNGNMERILAGIRRERGLGRTITPNSRTLAALFASQKTMSWDAFAKAVRAAERGHMGEAEGIAVRWRSDVFANPVQCVCNFDDPRFSISVGAAWRSLGERSNAANDS